MVDLRPFGASLRLRRLGHDRSCLRLFRFHLVENQMLNRYFLRTAFQIPLCVFFFSENPFERLERYYDPNDASVSLPNFQVSYLTFLHIFLLHLLVHLLCLLPTPSFPSPPLPPPHFGLLTSVTIINCIFIIICITD